MERQLLEHYNLKTLYPSEWPAEKDEAEDSDDEPQPSRQSTAIQRRRSRYSVLERTGSRSSVPNTEKTKEGVDTLVQKDEADPLGNASSVVNVLRQRGLPVEDDLKLRNRFLLSSTTFNPGLFLSQVHSDASTESLLQGLDFLSRSIEKKSASLKVLVESNFERFVRAKTTIDNVYMEMRDQGRDPAQPQSHSRTGSRQFSGRQSGHYRRASQALIAPGQVPVGDKRKTALTKESEYGVQGIKTPLLEVAVKAEEIWGPALGGRERGEMLKSILSSVEKHRNLFEIGASIQDCIKRRDYDMLPEEYGKARRYANDAKRIVENATDNRLPLTDPQIHQVIVTARMWTDVEEQLTVFKRDVWKRLAGTHFTKQSPSEDEKPEQHMTLIKVLLELGVEDNPIWVWLLSRYDFLKSKITATLERSKVEIEILRRRLGNGERPTPRQIATHLRAAETLDKPNHQGKIDSTKVIDFWDYELQSLNALLSPQGGVLAEVIEYWETAQSFIDGKAQRTLPVGPDGKSKAHHRLSSSGVMDLQGGAKELVNLIREGVQAFFTDPPLEDISLLYSPIPDTPATPRTPMPGGPLTPGLDARFKIDAHNPPPSPKTGAGWEKFAFWAPYSNSLSGVQYLSKILILVGSAASEIGAMRITRGDRGSEELKIFVGTVRERCVQAVCGAWGEDADYAKLLEDWTRWSDNKYLTHMPFRFVGLDNILLATVQKMLYLSEAMTRSSAGDVVVPPSSKLLAMVRSQFVTSIYKVLQGMVENVERPKNLDNTGWEDDVDGLTLPLRTLTTRDFSSNAVDATNKSIRILLTLSNLQALRTDLIPQLISQYEQHFSVKLEEGAKIDDALSQIYARLFQSYTSPISNKLGAIIKAGIAAPDWEPNTNHPEDARAYVYDVLLELVVVHTQVSTTAAPLTSQILKYLLEQASKYLIETFKARQHYTLAALVQATLDVEFLAQTLGNYTTDKTSEIQSAIYIVLDERTDNDARVKLQTELGELRVILKKLRESTKSEFACFKRARGHTKTERPSS
ncbi:Exocyst complex component S5 [Diplodia intermedia]|uniref:Exocyst complex component SEC5 n=1 Tax=Diplodia intermedia TaxID=856260 RepID=A0ABR3U3E7_9PEZI